MASHQLAKKRTFYDFFFAAFWKVWGFKFIFRGKYNIKS